MRRKRVFVPTWILVFGSLLPLIYPNIGPHVWPVPDSVFRTMKILTLIALGCSGLLYRRGVRVYGLVMICLYGFIAGMELFASLRDNWFYL